LGAFIICADSWHTSLVLLDRLQVSENPGNILRRISPRQPVIYIRRMALSFLLWPALLLVAPWTERRSSTVGSVSKFWERSDIFPTAAGVFSRPHGYIHHARSAARLRIRSVHLLSQSSPPYSCCGGECNLPALTCQTLVGSLGPCSGVLT
jgi:hypothetical protein